MKIDYSNPRSLQMFNKTCMRGWFHRKRKVRKKNYARAQRLLKIWIDYKLFRKEKIKIKRARKLSRFEGRQETWFMRGINTYFSKSHYLLKGE